MLNLAVVVNKDKDITSRGVVNKLNKIFNTKKIGHTGTLDPMAEGVLICLVGAYTKLVDIITSNEKEYIATIKLGIETDTLDITGKVLNENKQIKLDKDTIKSTLNSFIGEYEQTIPKYSAVHVNGKRLYEYARNNIEIELPKNRVFIKEIELLDYNNDLIKFRCMVSKGTYIRSLIQNICQKLNVIGCMSELIRTKQGNINIKDSYTIEDIENGNFKTLTIEDLLDVTIVNLEDSLYKKVINGNPLNMNYDGYVLFKKDNEEIALYYFEDEKGSIKIMLKSN